MSQVLAVVRTEARLLRHDPVPVVLLVVMPLVLMALLTPALRMALVAEGRVGTTGAEQTVPGMACVFSFFVVAVVAVSFFREHGWRTWPRLRVAGATSAGLLTAKLALPTAMLVVQHVLLFAVGRLGFGMEVAGSWAAVALVSLAYGAVVLTLGLVVAAVTATIQQANALTNLGAMVLGGLGGGFVPVDVLPVWLAPIAPASPTYWAMEGYGRAVLDGGGVADVLGPVGVLVAAAGGLALLAARLLRLDAPKRTWG